MDNIKVNKISVDIDRKEDNTTVSLYRTNKLLGVFSTDDLDIDSFSESGVSAKAYQAYVKDVVINLIDNDGIQGYYYEPKQESDSVKYDNSTFLAKAKEYVQNIIGDKYEFILMSTQDIETERYNNGYIKNASAKFKLMLKDYGISILLCCNIKSGQMCRPKLMIYNEEEYSFNITSINRIVKLNS